MLVIWDIARLGSVDKAVVQDRDLKCLPVKVSERESSIKSFHFGTRCFSFSEQKFTSIYLQFLEK